MVGSVRMQVVQGPAGAFTADCDAGRTSSSKRAEIVAHEQKRMSRCVQLG